MPTLPKVGATVSLYLRTLFLEHGAHSANTSLVSVPSVSVRQQTASP